MSTAVIPRSALVLGWLGVLPFAALAVVGVGHTPYAGPAAGALVLYAAIILSFMGGAQWGLAVSAQAAGPALLARRLALSVLPALAAFALALVPERAALLGLAAVFGALLAYDLITVRDGLAPPWYARLRIQLTAAVVLCLLLGAGFGRA